MLKRVIDLILLRNFAFVKICWFDAYTLNENNKTKQIVFYHNCNFELLCSQQNSMRTRIINFLSIRLGVQEWNLVSMASGGALRFFWITFRYK